jgi:hypothetical protein
VQINADAILANPQVINVYWGNWFRLFCRTLPCPGQSVRAAHETEWSTLANSSAFWSRLAEYGVGQGSYGGGFDGYPNIDTTQPISDTTITNQLKADIYAGRLPLPTTNNVYVVFLPNNMKAQSVPSGFGGRHDSFSMSFGLFGDATVHFAIIQGNGSDASGPDFTAAHEVLEAATDAVLGKGWNVTGMNQGEIGDLCGSKAPTTIAGYSVPAIWSRKSCSCID